MLQLRPLAQRRLIVFCACCNFFADCALVDFRVLAYTQIDTSKLVRDDVLVSPLSLLIYQPVSISKARAHRHRHTCMYAHRHRHTRTYTKRTDTNTLKLDLLARDDVLLTLLALLPYSTESNSAASKCTRALSNISLCVCCTSHLMLSASLCAEIV